MSNRTHVLYIGVTNDLVRRTAEHRDGLVSGFTQHYYLKRLVYFETFSDIDEAIAREKQFKGNAKRKSH